MVSAVVAVPPEIWPLGRLEIGRRMLGEVGLLHDLEANDAFFYTLSDCLANMVDQEICQKIGRNGIDSALRYNLESELAI